MLKEEFNPRYFFFRQDSGHEIFKQTEGALACALGGGGCAGRCRVVRT